MQVVYEDNHLIIVNKRCGEIVQGDKTGDTPLWQELTRQPAGHVLPQLWDTKKHRINVCIYVIKE